MNNCMGFINVQGRLSHDHANVITKFGIIETNNPIQLFLFPILSKIFESIYCHT